MKNIKYVVTTFSLALAVLLTLTACNSPVSAQGGPPAESEWPARGQGRGKNENATPIGEQRNDGVEGQGWASHPVELPTAELSDAEAQGILYMREEEKLARDVYLALYEQWGVQTFGNIANSESTHMEAVKTLIDRYGLDDPIEGKAAGEFANQELQALYDQLLEQGSQTLIKALRVGAAIEEIDILDLNEYAAQTDKSDIQRVYDSLTRGSRNHLRAFVSALEGQGETYQSAYLDALEYDEIVNTPTERGGGQGSNGGQGSRRSQESRGPQSGSNAPNEGGRPSGRAGQGGRGRQAH